MLRVIRKLLKPDYRFFVQIRIFIHKSYLKRWKWLVCFYLQQKCDDGA